MSRERLVCAAVLTLSLLSALRGQNLPVQFLPQINVFDGQGGPLLANRVYVRNGPLIVPPNRTLTIQPGAIIKLGVSFPFSSARSLVVDGTLIANGATFTSIHDDSVGGDTNGNGASTSPTPGDWDGIEFRPSSQMSSVNGCQISYGSAAGSAAVSVLTDDLAIINTVFRFSGPGREGAVDFSASGRAVIRNCSFGGGQGIAISGLSWAALPQLKDNVAAGNARGDFARVERVIGSTFGQNVVDAVSPASPPITVTPDNYPGGVLVVRQKTDVLGGGSLTIAAGVVVKFENCQSGCIGITGGIEAAAGATLSIEGTGAAPVTFTAIKDDSFFGDTNKDGPFSPAAPGETRGIIFADGSMGKIEHARIRFPLDDGLSLLSQGVTARSVWVDHGLQAGIRISRLQGHAANMVVADCTDGLVHDAVGVDIRHATLVNNTRFGVIKGNSFAQSSIRNSIVHGNGIANFDANFVASEVHHSNGGFAGINGNIDLTPLFAVPQFWQMGRFNPFTLSANSPCIDVADPAVPGQVVDHMEFSRRLAGTSGLPLPDMGAFERAQFILRSNESQIRIGSTVTLSTSLFPLTFPLPGHRATYLLGSPNASQLTPVGFLTVGTLSPTNTLTVLGTIPADQNLVLNVPLLPSLQGLTLGVQTFIERTSSPANTRAELTNRIRATIR